MNYAKLSKEISCALRRHPEYYGLEPDRAGFVCIDDLIRGINRNHPDAMPVTRNHIEKALAHSSKQRHEFYHDKVRALYGMSFRGRRTLAPRVPPKVLYHGTTPRVLDAIMREEFANNGLDKSVNQYFAVLTGIKSVGVMGDERTYENPVALTSSSIRKRATCGFAVTCRLHVCSQSAGG